MNEKNNISIVNITICLLSILIIFGTCLMWAGVETVTIYSLILLGCVQSLMIGFLTYHRHSKRKFNAPAIRTINPNAAQALQIATNKNISKKLDENKDLAELVKKVQNLPFIGKILNGIN